MHLRFFFSDISTLNANPYLLTQIGYEMKINIQNQLFKFITYISRLDQLTFGDNLMRPRFKESKKIGAHTRRKKRKEKFSLESLKKYWMFYGILAFLTTTLSLYPSFVSDLFSLVYFVGYVTSIGVAFIMVIMFLTKNLKNNQDQ